MPGDEDAVHRQGAHGVRRHGIVAQADDQGRALRGQQGLQLAPHRPDGPLKKIRLPLPEGGQVDGEIAALWLAQSGLAPAVQDVHPGHRIALLPLFCGFHACQAGGFFGRFLPDLPGLQGQISPFCKQNRFPPTQNLVVLPLGFAARDTIYKKITEIAKKLLLFGNFPVKISFCTVENSAA